jgi:hypothetical protein
MQRRRPKYTERVPLEFFCEALASALDALSARKAQAQSAAVRRQARRRETATEGRARRPSTRGKRSG